MKHLITKEPTEEIELDVEDGRFCLIQRIKEPDGISTKVIVMNKREALKLHKALGEEILNLGHAESAECDSYSLYDFPVIQFVPVS
ncbi:hypothetical protein LCGC14_3020220 [marine sediment metagenome]|uniref:Uncharacterized protein n=1 Tax=marine sediment metagenome TaxID=412755 RepID=A0A0F8Z355_9ZZZZ